MVKEISAHGGCLGSKRRRKTWQPAKSVGELATSIDPMVSEWGNPLVERLVSCTEYIGAEKRTQGTETSKYLEEKKSTEISLVVASDREGACDVESLEPKKDDLERSAEEGDSPVIRRGPSASIREVGRDTRNPV